MKRKISFCLAVLMILSTLALCVQAYPHENELEASEGMAFVKQELLVGTAEKLDMNDFEGEGPFDFFGISVVEIEDMNAGYEHLLNKETGDYYIKLAPEVDTFEAKKQLEACDGITNVDFNFLSYPDDDGGRYLDIDYSPYIGMTREELEVLHLFAPDEFTVYLDYELDLSEFEGEGKHYLYGVCVDTVSAIDTEEDSVFGYRIKLGEQDMPNCIAIWVLECNKNVVAVEHESVYGNGDINSDNSIDQYDYILAKRMYLETYYPTDLELGNADVNCDSIIDVYDYILICRHYFGTYTMG